VSRNPGNDEAMARKWVEAPLYKNNNEEEGEEEEEKMKKKRRRRDYSE